jgi:hypothetical protein
MRSGMAIVFLTANNSILMSVPPEYAGVVGGIFNACLQFGACTGLAVLGSIKSQFEDHSPSSSSSGGSAHGAILWEGYRASFIFMTVLCVVLAGISAVWFKNPLVRVDAKEKGEVADVEGSRS